MGAQVNFVGHDSILSINELGEHHIGNYTCVASNVAGRAAISFYVTVNGMFTANPCTFFFIPCTLLVAPKIQPFTFLGDLVEGSKGVRQTCFVSEGDPPLLVSWFRDGQDLEADPSVRVTRIDQLTSMLAISDLRSRHSGNYTCVAKNDVAAVAETAVLLVKGKYGKA